MSLAVTPRGSALVSSTRSTSGTVTRTAPVTIALAMSVVPTPKARQPRAPLCGMWESVPVKSLPNPTSISRPMATPLAVRDCPLNGLRLWSEGAVGKWPAGATVTSLA